MKALLIGAALVAAVKAGVPPPHGGTHSEHPADSGEYSEQPADAEVQSEQPADAEAQSEQPADAEVQSEQPAGAEAQSVQPAAGGAQGQEVATPVALLDRCVETGTIALTFDGGPGQATGLLLNKLRDMQVHVTFHISTAHLNQDLIETYARAQRDDGHTIGLYWNPPQRIADMTDEEIIAALIEESDAVHKATGVHPRYIRLPHNSVDQRLLDILEGMSFIPTTHNFDPEDYGDNTAAGMRAKYEVAFEQYQKGGFQGRFITVHHDTTPTDMSEAIEAVVDVAREAIFDYDFVTLDDCLGQAMPYKSDAAGRGPLLNKAGMDPSSNEQESQPSQASASVIDRFSLFEGAIMMALAWL